jgi:hypothetical protein
VADVEGQFSLYAAGPPSQVLLAAPYDQFLKKNYDPIMKVWAAATSAVGHVCSCLFIGVQLLVCLWLMKILQSVVCMCSCVATF